MLLLQLHITNTLYVITDICMYVSAYKGVAAKIETFRQEHKQCPQAKGLFATINKLNAILSKVVFEKMSVFKV